MNTGALVRHLVAATAALPPHRGICVACSGGTDSIALLHGLHAAGIAPLRVVHVHHGLQAAADHWAMQLRDRCTQLGLRFDVIRVQVEATGQGPEADARRARYAALRGQLEAGEVLAVAHHAEDQTETVLLRLARGSGLRGAGAMAPLRRFGTGWLWRPLLEVGRRDIEAWLAAHGLQGVDDPHNRDRRYARSHLRHEVMPRLRERHPGVDAALGRFATDAREAAALLDHYADVDLAALGGRFGPPVAALLALPPPRRRLLLRRYLARQGLLPPSAAWLERLQREVLAGGVDRHPELPIEAAICCRHDRELLLRRRLPPVPAGWAVDWDGRLPLALPGGGRLAAAAPLGVPVRVRYSDGGERLRLRAGGPSRRLRNLVQEARMPVWVRRRLPVIEVGGRPLVVGHWHDVAAGRLLHAQLVWTPPAWRWPAAPGSR